MPITRRMIGPQIVHQEYSASNRRPNPIEALKNEEFESYLVGHLGDDDPIIRSSAKELLLNFRSSKAVKLLLDVVNGSSSNKARMNAIWVLGELGAYDKELIIPYSVEDLLIKLLKENSDMAIHSYAAEALGKIGTKKAAIPLIESLGHGDPALSRFAVQALGRIKDPRTMQYIARLLKGKDFPDRGDSREVSWHAAHALGNMGSDAVKFLVNSLKNRDPEFRLDVLEILNDISDRDGKMALLEAPIRPVVECLDDINPKVREGAIQLLGKIKNPRTIKNLSKFLKNDNLSILILTIESLGMIGDPKIIEPLVLRLDANNVLLEDRAVCLSIVNVLSNINDPTIPDHLLSSFFKNNDPDVRLTILKELVSMVGERVITPLVIGLGDRNELIKSHAEEALNSLNREFLKAGLSDCMENCEYQEIRERAELILSQLV